MKAPSKKLVKWASKVGFLKKKSIKKGQNQNCARVKCVLNGPTNPRKEPKNTFSKKPNFVP